MIKTFSYIVFSLFLLLSADSDARKGNEAYAKGNYAEAEQLYRAAIDQDPENAKLYFNLGNALAKQGKTEEAIQTYLEYRGLVETPEEKSLAEYNIGTTLAETEKWKPASLHFRNSLRLNPRDTEAKTNYELALSKMESEDEQQQQQNQEQDNIEPSEYAKAMKAQAEKLVELQRYQEAYDLMNEAMKVDETVNAFKDFIQRTKDVADINS
ncbi:tetratricopeptide repeat protein [Balneola sp. MJW-20]|uniref:tetratricopeptide repeat protein n=1 Tax=Gracilimonas aurantiaca TaxID=3234185 RepID=UPI0034653717